MASHPHDLREIFGRHHVLCTFEFHRPLANTAQRELPRRQGSQTLPLCSRRAESMTLNTTPHSFVPNRSHDHGFLR